MALCVIELRDEVNCKLIGLSTATARKLSGKYSYILGHARFSSAYKLGRWDGKVSFFSLGGLTYIQLLNEIVPILMDDGYEIEVSDLRTTATYDFQPITDDYFSDKTWPKGHQMEGKPIVLRGYQVETVNKFLENTQSVQVVATGGGKTLVTAALSAIIEKHGRTLVIVPNKSLVTQTEADYINLGLDVGVYFGDRKELNKTHTICTWQSLMHIEKAFKSGSIFGLHDFSAGVVAVIVDEVHGAQAAALKKLLAGPFSFIPIRLGFSGTLPEEISARMAVTCMVGHTVGGISAATLQDMGVLSGCFIDVQQLQDDRPFTSFPAESAYLTTNEDRLAYLARYFKSISKDQNTLILVGKIKTGKMLEELFDDPGNVVFVNGGTGNDDRKAEYDKVKDANGLTIIATYGVAAVGIDIARLHNVVLFEPGKSFVRVIQSIGRGLRTAKDKDFVNIYDITSNCKYSKKHLTQRKKFYKEAGYKYAITKVDWRK
jgi:superfamily II DNA or RNA helicase